jgi:multidrug transporter EmrE-like cation transporter
MLGNKYGIWSGFGLVLGAAAGTILFAFTGRPWDIGIVAGLGLIFGAMIGLQKTDKKFP